MNNLFRHFRAGTHRELLERLGSSHRRTLDRRHRHSGAGHDDIGHATENGQDSQNVRR